jgi:hypothetical protein
MRYNPSTESNARTIDAIAAECRVAITKHQEEKAQPALWSADDIFYAGQCKTWSLCRRVALSNGDRDGVARMESWLARDMHKAIHHRPHQPEF